MSLKRNFLYNVQTRKLIENIQSFVICTCYYHYFVNILHIRNMHSEIFNQDFQKLQYRLNENFLYLDP